MKTLALLTFILFLGYNSSAINFGTYSVEESLQKAKLENKKVFVFYSALWCMPCEIMKEGVFKDASINALMDESMVPVMVYYDEAIPTEWIQKFDVKCLPTSLVLDADGNVISRYEGGMGTDRFMAFLKNETWADPIKKDVIVIADNKNINNKTSTDIPSSSVAKIILDGKEISVSDKVVTDKVEKVATAIEVITKEENLSFSSTEESNFTYVIQFGAFNTLEKIKLHQKNLKSKLAEETMIIVDPSVPSYPFKLVSKHRFKESQVEDVVKSIKSKGLDCFPKSI